MIITLFSVHFCDPGWKLHIFKFTQFLCQQHSLWSDTYTNLRWGNRASSRVKCQMYRLKNAAAAAFTLNKSGARLRQLFQFIPIWNAYRKGRRNKLQAINRVKILPLSVTVCIVRETKVEAWIQELNDTKLRNLGPDESAQSRLTNRWVNQTYWIESSPCVSLAL